MEQGRQSGGIGPAIEVTAGGDSLRPRSIRVFGIGGAGCSIIKTLRGQHSHGPRVALYTANRVEADLQADLAFGSGIDSPLTSEDRHLISELVRPGHYVILSAGLGGKTGATLIPHFAMSDKTPGCKVVAMVVLSFSFEGKHISVARKAASELAEIVDLVITFDLASLTKSFPGNTSLNAFMDFVNGLAAKASQCHRRDGTSPAW